MEYKILYYVVPEENFKAEERLFLKGEKYPVYDKNGRSLLVGENGEFYFTNELMKQAIHEWNLNVVEANWLYEQN